MLQIFAPCPDHIADAVKVRLQIARSRPQGLGNQVKDDFRDMMSSFFGRSLLHFLSFTISEVDAAHVSPLFCFTEFSGTHKASSLLGCLGSLSNTSKREHGGPPLAPPPLLHTSNPAYARPLAAQPPMQAASQPPLRFGMANLGSPRPIASPYVRSGQSDCFCSPRSFAR